MAPADTSHGTSSLEIAFRRPAELRELGAAPQPDWIWDGFLARRHTTLLSGKPKVGKSTVVAAIANAVAGPATAFLGHPVATGETLVITEESRSLALAKYKFERFSLLTREDIWPLPTWAELLSAIAARSRDVGAILCILDTLATWTRMRPEQEKDPSAMQSAMDALAEVLRTDAGVLVVHHQRKGGGEEGEATRGTNAIVGASDCLIEYERLGDDAPPRHRQLVAIGRWPTRGLTVVDFDPGDGSYRVIGQGEGRGEADGVSWRARLLEAIPKAPGAAAQAELERLLGADKRKWHPTLNELVDEELVVRGGAGRKGDPYVFSRSDGMVSSDAVPATGQKQLEGAVLSRRETAPETQNGSGAQDGTAIEGLIDFAELGVPTLPRSRTVREGELVMAFVTELGATEIREPDEGPPCGHVGDGWRLAEGGPWQCGKCYEPKVSAIVREAA